MNSTQQQQGQIEEINFFDNKGLDALIKQMQCEEAIAFDEKPKAMMIEIGNEFLNKLLDESIKISLKRQQNEDTKAQKPKLTIQDVKFALQNSFHIPQQSFQVDKEN